MKYLVLLLNVCLTVVAANAAMPTGDEFTNSIGMEFVRIEPGAFLMGSDEGDFDERPVHEVTISRTRGRHSAFVILDKRTILSYGGKNDHIEGFMPKNVSTDGGRTWQVSKSSVPMLGGRPVDRGKTKRTCLAHFGAQPMTRRISTQVEAIVF